MKKILLIIVALVSFLSINATHLIGGNLGYEYVGQFGSNYRYKIILTTYTNCNASSNIPQPEGPNLTIGVYGHDIQNSPLTGNNKQWITNAIITLVDSNKIDPNLPGTCPIGSNVCIYKGVYEGFVDLPLNFNGYHVFYERCCRNGSIVNLIPSESMAFHAYIPSPLLPNSSPVFTDDPVPFLCAGDTTTILNTAYDADGDLLVFSFVTPYNGFANINNPAPFPPQPNLGWTIPTVTYAGGYSTASPFGSGGYSYINGSTGLTSYYPSNTGDYVVAVEIKEYRNGNLIGVTRRDLQLLVLNCSPNGTPALSNSLGSTSTQYSVTEGETLCFDFGYDDPEGDSVMLTVNGQIFDASIVNPPATVNSPVSDLDTVSTSFCWTTVCGQAQNLPYQFQVSARDNGCPPKSNNNVFQITVDPVAPPDTILGPDIICENTTQTYTTQTVSNTTYNWTVNGGVIVNDNGSSVDILWGSAGAGIVSLSATNQFGCNSEPISLNVTKTLGPTVNAGSDVAICLGDTIQLNGSGTICNSCIESWSPTTDMINPNTFFPSVFPQTTTDYVFTINMGGGACANSDTVRVIINQPQINGGPNEIICFGDSVQLNATGASSYFWTPNVSISNTAINNPYVSPSVTQDYIVSGSDGNGCLGSDTVNVLVNSLPNASAGNDVSLCEGSSVTLNASGGVSYVWSPALNLSSTSIANPITNTTTSNVYYVEVTDANGCKNIDSIAVTVNANPTIDAGLDAVLCDGDSIQLQATGGVTYSWNADPTLSNVGIANPFASPSIVTDYIVTGTDINNCIGSDTVSISVNQIPSLNAGVDTSLCLFDTIQLNATGTGLSFSWSPSTNISSTTISNPLVFPTVTQDYIVAGTDGNNCVAIDTVNVLVHTLPIANAGEDFWVCPGSSKTLNGSGGIIYAWSPNLNITDTTVANPSITPVASIDYALEVTDVNGCLDTDTMRVVFGNFVPTDAGADKAICVGDTLIIGGSPTSVIGSDYAWSPSGSILDTTIANPLVFPTISTDYIIYTSNDTCSGVDTMTVTVNQLPIVDAGLDVQICIGDSTQLTASGGVTYNWNNSILLTNATIANPIAFPTDTTAFIATATDANSCVNTDTVNVIVNPLPIANAGLDTLICYGDSLQLIASGGDEYVWTPDLNLDDDSIANPWTATLTTETYFVKVTDSNGCVKNDSVTVTVAPLPIVNAGVDTLVCVSDTVQLNAFGADTYAWNTTVYLSDTSINNPFAYPLVSTDFIVFGTELVNGCSSTDTVKVFIQQSPVLNISPISPICIGDSAQLSVSGGSEYAWSPNVAISDTTISNPVVYPSVSTTYLVSGFDTIGCGSQGQVLVVVNPLPNIQGNPTSVLSICKGDSVQLEASGGVSYSWSPTQTLSSSLISDPFAFPLSSTEYNVVGTDANGCVNDAVVVLEVFEVTTIPDTTICLGESVALSVQSSPGNAYLWSPTNDLSSSTIANPIATPSSTTTYVVSVTNNAGCQDQASVTITTLSASQPNVTTTVEADCEGTTISFQNNTTNASSYTWTFGDGTSSSEESPTHLFDYDGTYSAVLVTTDPSGCNDTLTLFGNTLVFSELFSADPPNVFTPNGDGENDLYEVALNPSIEECTSFIVFNRWGQLIFESDGSSISWDGKKANGNKVPEGTYFYIIDLNGVTYKGTMTIFR
jgi:gliding motility-associated-like protein